MAEPSPEELLFDTASQTKTSWNIQEHLIDDVAQLALLNAALDEGLPELLAGAIWDVAKANGLGLGSVFSSEPDA